MSPDRSVSLVVPRKALWLFAILLVAPWLAFGLWMLAGARSPSPPASRAAWSASSANSGSDVMKCRPGPWGELECTRILIEPPEEFVVGDAEIQSPLWTFKGYSEVSLAALWQAAGLDAAQQKFVHDPAHCETMPDGILVRPSREFIVGLSPGARAAIYTALSEFPENFAQFSPFRLRTSLSDTWLDQINVPAEVVALTKQLLYERGNARCFSDQDIVLPLIPAPQARTRYLKALARKSALMVQLRVQAGQDVDALVAYWGRGGRSKDLKPLLQSLSRRPNGGTVDIVHLLPRFVRLLAYTYPVPSDEPADANRDCHWTALNFQNDQPDDRFANIDYVREVLLKDYYPVPGEPTLGDIVMFARPDGVVMHSCVYIADDIVFTKNGPGHSIPWLFSSSNDVEAFYTSMQSVQIRRYRAKKL